MTNEEAIKYITSYVYYHIEDIPDNVDEALDIAITALKEQKDRPQGQGEWIIHNDYHENCRYGCNRCGNLTNINSRFCPNCGIKMRVKAKGGAECMDEDVKQASIPYTYNAPQHDWKCGYPDITRGKE